MIYLVSLHTDRMTEFNHIKRELLERYELVSMGSILIIDCPSDTATLKTAILEIAPLHSRIFIAAVGGWATCNMPSAENWLRRKILVTQSPEPL